MTEPPLLQLCKNLMQKQQAKSPMLQLYKDAMHREKTEAPYNCIAGWANDESRFVTTLCNNDNRNTTDKKFNIHVPVDSAIIRVVHRRTSVSGLEQSACVHVNEIISTIPTRSFMIVCRIKNYCVKKLRTIGECGLNEKGYWELSLRTGKFEELTKILEDESVKEYTTVLVHIRPAFIMPQGSTAMGLQDEMRDDTNTYTEQALNKLSLEEILPYIDKTEEGWNTEQTCTVNEMAEHIQGVDNVRRLLFDKIETNIDHALSEYKTWAKAMGDSRSYEIVRNYTESSAQSPPSWWPKRLVDVRMNALIPGENVWYIKGSFNTLSYTWETDNSKLHKSARPFASFQTVYTYSENAYNDLRKTINDVDSINEYLWIDAICVYQTNNEEKLSEVKRSSEYYRRCNKCIVYPSGLSQNTNVDELSSSTLPRWFYRAWTLQEAALAEFIVGRFIKDKVTSYLDRYDIVKLLDNNTQQSGLIISSARQIMRRAGLNALHPATIVEWALAREATLDQDIIYGTASMFTKEDTNIEIVGDYNTCIRCVIMRLAQTMCGKDRTSLTTLTGKGWLPSLIRKDELVGITTESKLNSYVQSDGSLLIEDTIAMSVDNVTLHDKIANIGDDYKRYSQSRSRRFDIAELAAKCSKLINDKKYAGDNAAARAWVAVTYMSSDVLELSCGNETKTMRVIALNDIGFSHLIFVGYARQSVYLERVYICASLQNDNVFFKKGTLAEPVGTIMDDDKDCRTNVVLAEGASCSCHENSNVCLVTL